MSNQHELFEARYAEISQGGHIGWSDAETCAKAIEMYHKLLNAVGAFDGRLLELGCGRGNIALNFAKLGWHATGVDFSSAAIAWANEFAIHENLEAEFLVGDLAEKWPFEDETFDAVLDANCLHFFHGEDRAHFLSEARRVLTASGTFVLSSIVNQPREEHWEMLGYDPVAKVSRRDDVVMNNFMDASELLAEVMEAGFRILSSVVTEGDSEMMWIVARKKESPL